MDYKAFVASSFQGLKEHRLHVIRELRKAGFHVDPAEEWTSAAQEPHELSKQRLDGCKLCVLLVARKRGTVPDGMQLTITQMEVEEARHRQIDVLPFLLDDAAEWPAELDERASDPALRQWLADLHHGKYGSVNPELSRFTNDDASIQIGPALTRWVKEKGAEVAIDLYLNLVEQEHGTIQFLGLPHLKDKANAPIQRLYVEPAVSPRWVSPDTDPIEWPTTKPVLDIVAENQRLVLLGDPGSGKSTLVSWIAWQLARHHRDGANPWTECLRHLVPLPFVLRDLGIGKGVTWDTLLAAFLNSPKGKLLELADVPKLLRDGRAIILLDGLDEIGNPSVRRDLRDAVWKGMDKHLKCRWLLTSRVVGYHEVLFHEQSTSDIDRLKGGNSGLPHEVRTYAGLHYVTPFDDGRVEQFADNWFVLRAVSQVSWELPAKEFVTAVRADDSTKKLGRIPNLLVMMALIHRNDAHLPHGRARLYAKIAEAYLETIDHWRHIERTSEEWTVRKRWLARVGFELQRRRSKPAIALRENDEILATGEEVRGWIVAAMAESGQPRSEWDAGEFVEYLGKRSGLLLPCGQDRFAFLHLSFQEYFAACFLQEQIVSPDWLTGVTEGIAMGADSDSTRRYANEPVWRETLVFLIEMMAFEHPRWLGPTRKCLFGSDLTNLQPGADKNQNRIHLLARLAVDPYTGFDLTLREQAIRACCQWEMTMQHVHQFNVWKYDNSVARTLLSVDRSVRQTMVERLVDAAHQSGIIRLNLRGTGVNDLSPLSRLRKLQLLDVSGTRVNDIGPLAELEQLEVLSIEGTGVSDLRPLAGLGWLQWLSLKDTGVNNLGPLAELTHLTSLNLIGTRVSMDMVTELRSQLPRCVIQL